MEEIDRKIIELYQEMGRGQGINDTLMLELFCRLYIEPEPVAMEELAKKTGYSLASVSNKIRMIGPVLNIKRIKKPGSKKVYLYMEKDIFKFWKDALLAKEHAVILRVKEKLPAILKEYSEKSKSNKDKEKIKILDNYYRQILQFDKLLKKMIVEFEKIK